MLKLSRSNIEVDDVMKKILILSTTVLVMCTSISVMADAKDWSKYRTVERKQPHYPTTTYKYTDQYGRPMTEEIPVRRPQYQQPYSNHHYSNHSYPNQNYPHRPYPSRDSERSGVTVIYNHSFPTQTEYRSDRQGFVYGDSNARIESSRYTLISDWRRYGLPDPQVGMHWIYENGRYVQIPNTR